MKLIGETIIKERNENGKTLYFLKVREYDRDGKYEAIYDKNTGNLVTDPRDIGTYNYYTSFM